MIRFLNYTLVLQLLLVASFFWFVYQADLAMDKSGIGNIKEFKSFNKFAGVSLYAATATWFFTLIFTLFRRAHNKPQAQLSIGLPPLLLIIGWTLMWLI